MKNPKLGEIHVISDISAKQLRKKTDLAVLSVNSGVNGLDDQLVLLKNVWRRF